MAKLSEYLKNGLLIIIILQLLPSFLSSAKKQLEAISEPKTKVAYLTIKDSIDEATPHTKLLRKYFKNPEIKAILLKIESPGGASGSAQAIFQEIATLKKEYSKPIISYVENICGSAAYYIAAATDIIVAEPSSLVGSIGAYITAPQLKQFIEKYDIKFEIIKSGSIKGAGNPFLELTSEQRANFQELADDCYRQFTQDVAQKRPKLSLKNSLDWANGKIFTGQQALTQGLVDEVGSELTAIEKIKEKAEIDTEIEWVKPAKLSRFAEFFNIETSLSTLASKLYTETISARF